MLPETVQAIEQLENIDLPVEDRIALTAALLSKARALPLDNTLVVTPQSVVINGKALEMEQLIHFKESCIALHDNQARKIIHEQLRFLAIVEGVHKGLNPDQIQFSKAALWILQEEAKLIEQIVTYGTQFAA